MNAAQRRRISQAVASRIREMPGASAAAVARAAHVDPKTIRKLVRDGLTPCDDAAQSRIERVLKWPAGEITERAVRDGSDRAVDAMTDLDLSIELTRRLEERSRRDAQLRANDLRRGNPQAHRRDDRPRH